MDKYTASTNTVIITRDHYRELKDAANTLRLLENAGVDNWEWYGEALKGDDE